MLGRAEFRNGNRVGPSIGTTSEARAHIRRRFGSRHRTGRSTKAEIRKRPLGKGDNRRTHDEFEALPFRPAFGFAWPSTGLSGDVAPAPNLPVDGLATNDGGDLLSQPLL